ncbi:MAG TPA: heparan-alpha-glucosaminide N-acetyltransferase [Hyphomicrobiales bacterium]|nr:heparan-alpha-glucosaminide N-acetyltransferase [Hyphomicrobiales bacterium]
MRLDAPAGSVPSARLTIVDAARGAALVAMAVYHFAWDLRFYSLIAAEVSTGFGWRLFAHLIAGSFLGLVGVSLVLATRHGIRWRAFGRRLALIVAAALAVTAVTRWLFPDDHIFFGILDEIAVASVVGLAFVRLPWWLTAVVAAAVFAAPAFLASPAFNHPLLWWTGLLTVYPATNDFEPVLPWFGYTLLGIALARLVLPKGERLLARWQSRGPLSGALVWGGRHSLAIYLAHQPILFGIATGLSLVLAPVPPPGPPGAAFRESCVAACRSHGTAAARCTAMCGCIVDDLRETPLWPSVVANRMSPAEEARASAVARRCAAPP